MRNDLKVVFLMSKLHFGHSFTSEKVDIKSFTFKSKMFMAIALFLAYILC